MKAILKREIKAYFSSPIGYVCVAALTALYGYFYYYYISNTGSMAYSVPAVYNSLFSFCMMIIPIITMRSMTEEIKSKTDQALLTAPVSVTGIVTGKFLAAYFVFFIASTFGMLPVISMVGIATIPWGVMIGNYIGTLLYGGAMIAIGIFISSLTESQVIAAIGTFIISVLLMFLDGFTASIQNEIASKILSWISFNSRYTVFTQGLFNVPNAIFFISVMCIFVFLTSRRVESRRWS